jgi:sec-independent protein translocase protein TatB
MFDFSFSEIAVFGVVALLAIGPKDLPVAMRAVSNVVKKARKMASEFQGHVDEMMREANLNEVSDHLRDLRNFNIKNQINRAIDPDNELGNLVAGVNVAARPETVITRPDESDPVFAEVPAPEMVVDAPPETTIPAFIPPSCVRPAAPAFVPPGAIR